MTDPALQALHELSDRVGIETAYRDAWGAERLVAAETLQSLLGVMGFPTASPEEIGASLQHVVEAEWSSMLPPVVVADLDRPCTVPINLATGATDALTWQVVLEDGSAIDGAAVPDDLERLAAEGQRTRRLLSIEHRLPAGYHRLILSQGAEAADAVLIVAPAACYLPPDFAGDGFGLESQGAGRVWGLAAQLYSLRSPRNWGIGDFADLKELAIGSAARGARAIGLNPLHALFPAEPRHVSPYSPSSRRFLNPLYLDIEAIPDFGECAAARELVHTPAFVLRLQQVRDSNLVDHVAVASAKNQVLALLWRSFAEKHLTDTGASSARGQAYRKFERDGGAALADFALFEALHAAFGHTDFSWRHWPEGYRDPASPEVGQFKDAHRDQVGYFIYLQWEADRQLGDVDYIARAAGLSVGLYRDIAVGTDPSGAEGWSDQRILLRGATIGAPPDILNLKGQNWGLNAADPRQMQASAYASFIAAIRANMRHAGAIRLDHVMALKHLYVIPEGNPSGAGSYIRYPMEDLLRVVALESHRARCAVVGEDLGTVPEGFRERLEAANILSYRLLVFERRVDGTFLPPSAYPPLATASSGTHDLPTLKGFWLGNDLDWRERLDMYPDPSIGQIERTQRVRERRLLLDALIAQGVLPPTLAAELLPEDEVPVFHFELVEAVHRYLGESPARLMLIQLEDAVGSEDMINLPGTTDEHPNWRRKLSLSVAEILDNQLFRRLTEAAREARSRSPAVD